MDLLLALVALSLWTFVFMLEKRRTIGWISPTCLFSLGLIVFYIVPSIYWIFRPWSSSFPPYFDGIWKVMLSAIILGLPFLFYALQRRHKLNVLPIKQFMLRARLSSNKIVWLFFILATVSVYFEIQLLLMGQQSRLGYHVVSLFGSPDLGYLLISNLLNIWPIFYLALIFFGGRKARILGVFFWMADGIICISTLQRAQMLNFLLYSFVAAQFLGYKFSFKKNILVVLSVVFILVVVGNAPKFARYSVESKDIQRLNFKEVVNVLYDSTVNIMDDSNVVMRYSDKTMERLYEARSASAVMANVPDKINYQNGATFIHAAYAFIPRYFWPEKPSLREIHYFTTEVMPDDEGVNPLGTIGEFYINFGFLSVFLGGLVSLWICLFLEKRFVRYYILNKHNKLRALIVVYPISAIWIFGSSYNFTQRISEGLRLSMLFFALCLMFYFLDLHNKRKSLNKAQQVHRSFRKLNSPSK